MFRSLECKILALGLGLAASTSPSLGQEQTLDTSRVTVLCYHRFEDPPRDPLAISTAEFRQQLQAIKDAGLPVISVEDFLAWRRGEKQLAPESVLITIDDGFNCGYKLAWPILKEFDYPFIMYVYTNYISAGGRSVTWEMLQEMQKAGVAVHSHSVSHPNLASRRGRSEDDYRAWLENELIESKRIIEEKMGQTSTTFSYPYGAHNSLVREIAVEAGYEAMFTVAGQKLAKGSPADQLGRYVIESGKPQLFRLAINFGGPSDAASMAAQDFNTHPSNGAIITDPLPTIQADLSRLADLDPLSVSLALSGYGQVPAVLDPETRLLTYTMHERLRGHTITASVTAKAGGQNVAVTWTFVHDPLPALEGLIAEATPPDQVSLAPVQPEE